MNKFNLYLTVDKWLTKKAKESVASIAELIENSVIYFTLHTDSTKIHMIHILSLFFFESKVFAQRKCVINNYIEGKTRKISLIAKYLMRKMRIGYISIIDRFDSKYDMRGFLEDKHRCRVENVSCDEFEKWAKAENAALIEQYDDAISAYNRQKMVSCRYNTCLGNTLAVDGSGNINICPYRSNNISLNALSNCASITEIFNTESFMSLLESTVMARSICKTVCSLFQSCQGGCPLEHLSNSSCREEQLAKTVHLFGDTVKEKLSEDKRLQQTAKDLSKHLRA